MIGSAEYLALPVDSFDLLDGVDDPVESIELIAADYVATFRPTASRPARTSSSGSWLQSRRRSAARQGLRYGFEELDGGRVVEKNLIYGVRGDDTIDLFNFSAIAEGACLSNEGELADPALLDSLLPALDQVMAVVESG